MYEDAHLEMAYEDRYDAHAWEHEMDEYVCDECGYADCCCAEAEDE